MAGRKPTQAAESKETPANTELIKQDFESINPLLILQRDNNELIDLVGRIEAIVRNLLPK